MLSPTTLIGILSLGTVTYAVIYERVPDPLTASIALSFLGLVLTYLLVPALGPSFMEAGLSGRDLLKKDKKTIPEAMGAVCAVVYLMCLVSFIPFPFYEFIKRDDGRQTDGHQHGFPHHKLAEFLGAILSLQSMIALGFADDVFDIRWRYKLPLPIVASIPLLIVYYVNFGETHIVLPNFLRAYTGKLLELGFLYYAYMALVVTFCTNAINILAGINGIEVAQSLIIAISIAINDSLFLQPGHPALELHLFSLYIILPFIGVSTGLLIHNWFPSRVFVGDTYCYFAGMTFAVVGILGHFSKTLLLFFLPQIFNFIYSCPQLFRLVPCPRHRMPRLNPRTGLLEPSRARLHPSPIEELLDDITSPPPEVIPLKPITKLVVLVLENLGLADVTRTKPTHNGNGHGHKHGDTGEPYQISNLTLLNILLVTFGPMSERHLAMAVCAVQVGCSAIAFAIRYGLAGVLYSY